jgi:hypothetical protein
VSTMGDVREWFVPRNGEHTGRHVAENLSSIDTDPVEGRMREDVAVKPERSESDPAKKTLIHMLFLDNQPSLTFPSYKLEIT